MLKLIILLTLLSSTLYMNYSSARIFTVAFCFVLIFGFVFYKSGSKTSFKINTNLSLVFFLFVFSGSISALLNQEAALIFGVFALSIIYLAFYIVVPNLKGLETNKIVYKSIIITSLFVVVLPVLSGISNSGSYRGIFDNPNSFGIASATFFIALLSKFYGVVYSRVFEGVKLSLKQALFYSLSLSLGIVLVLLSGSRTSFLTCLVSVGVFFSIVVYLLIKNRSKSSIVSLINFIVPTGIITAIIYFSFPIQRMFENIILSKFQVKINQGDVLSERGFIWEYTISNATLFGEGRDYFSGFEAGAHNTFISLLGQYGWVPTLLFIFFLLLSAIYALKYALNRTEDEYRILPLMIMICFVTLSMGEGMLFKTPMVAAFATAGVTTTMIKSRNRRKKCIKQEKHYD